MGIKIKEYTVVHAITPIELQKLVNGMLDEDWIPVGGLCVDNYGKYYQSMIRYYDV